jgi:hypothetical protein
VVVVERNLRASDLCQLLALKNRVAKDVSWTIVEQWVDLGLGKCHRWLFYVYFASVSPNTVSKYDDYANFLTRTCLAIWSGETNAVTYCDCTALLRWMKF